MTLPNLPADKANHLIYGALIFCAAGWGAVQLGYAAQAREVGAGAALAFGLAKEAADWLLNRRAAQAGQAPPHGVEAADALATAAGGVLCWAAAVLTS